MALVYGWVLFALVAALDLVAFVGARYLAARRGAGRLRVALGADGGAWASARLARRLVFVGAGPLGWYLAASAFFLAASLSGGRMVVDESSMRVTVVPGGPAAVAGLVDGDAIVSVGAVPIADWTQLKAEISKHAGEAIDVDIRRGDHALSLRPTPDPLGKIGVRPPSERRPVGLGGALGHALVGPAKVNALTLRGLLHILAGSERAELAGPVGIVREVGRSSTPGGQLELVAVIDSYFLWVPTVVAFAVFPWRRKRDARPAS